MKKNVKHMLCAVLVIMTAALLVVFVAGAKEMLREADLERKEEGHYCSPPYIRWDDKEYYWTGEKVYEDLLCPDVVGRISAFVCASQPITKNGQTNISELEEGDEIRRTAYGDAIAVFVENEWKWLERRDDPQPEEDFYVPKNVWRLFEPDKAAVECGDAIPGMKQAAECESVTLTVTQAVVDAETFINEPHIALVLKNDSEHVISYRRGGAYVLKEMDGEWYFWLGGTEPGEVQETPYVLSPTQEERFLAPLAEAFPGMERTAGIYRIGMYVDIDSGSDKTAGNVPERVFVSADFSIR